MRARRVFLFALVFVLPLPALAVPAQVIIMRHAEESALGCKRAFLLPKFLASFGRPAAIYAQRPNALKPSLRSVQTAAPTAFELHMNVNAQFEYEKADAMARSILAEPSYDGRTVLIFWEHKAIPALAAMLGLKKGPTTWPDDVFDEAWVLHFSIRTNGKKTVQTVSLNVAQEAIPQTDVHECLNNDKLNAMTRGVATPPLP